MNKKEYTAPAIEVFEDFTSELLADSDPSKWGIENGPDGNENQDDDEGEGTRSKRGGGFTSWASWDDDDEF